MTLISRRKIRIICNGWKVLLMGTGHSLLKPYWFIPSFCPNQTRREMRESAWQRPGWNETVTYTVQLIRHMESKIMVPTSFSPMKWNNPDVVVMSVMNVVPVNREWWLFSCFFADADMLEWPPLHKNCDWEGWGTETRGFQTKLTSIGFAFRQVIDGRLTLFLAQ